MMFSSNKTIECSKHMKSQVLFVCSMYGCNFGSLICDNCIKIDPQHTSLHKNYIYNLNDFLNHQNNRLSTKLIPSLSQTLIDIEKKISFYTQHIETETQEIDRDFATLFKIFFNASETTKTFLKENIKNELKRFSDKLIVLKGSLKDIGDQESPKKSDSFLPNFLTKDPDKIEAASLNELISKLIIKNQPFNRVRADVVGLNNDIDSSTTNPIKYKKNDQAKKLYEEIKENFDKSCKDMYRQFKLLIEGGEQADMRKSIFTMKKSLQPQPQTISIDLDAVANKNFQSPNTKIARNSSDSSNSNGNRILL